MYEFQPNISAFESHLTGNSAFGNQLICLGNYYFIAVM
jgi:hypothetical protein